MKPNVILLFFLCIPVIVITSCSSLHFESSSLAEKRYHTVRGLIITADDFGASDNINEGIIRGIDAGFINTVSAMVTFPSAIENIKLLASSYPEINIGLHLSLTSGYPIVDPDRIPSLVNENGSFYSIDQLIPRLDKINPDEVKLELEHQIDSFLKAGIAIDHLSSQHNILHIYSPFTRIVMSLAVEYDLPMRSTRAASVTLSDFSYSKTRNRGLDLAGKLVAHNPFGALKFLKYTRMDEMERNQQLMEKRMIAHPEYLIDSFWGSPGSENLYHILTHLPEGVSEIVFHLGVNENNSKIPPGIEGEYYLMREFELMSLNNIELERWMSRLNIQKTTYRSLIN